MEAAEAGSGGGGAATAIPIVGVVDAEDLRGGNAADLVVGSACARSQGAMGRWGAKSVADRDENVSVKTGRLEDTHAAAAAAFMRAQTASPAPYQPVSHDNVHAPTSGDEGEVGLIGDGVSVGAGTQVVLRTAAPGLGCGSSAGRGS